MNSAIELKKELVDIQKNQAELTNLINERLEKLRKNDWTCWQLNKRLVIQSLLQNQINENLLKICKNEGHKFEYVKIVEPMKTVILNMYALYPIEVTKKICSTCGLEEK